MEVAIVLIQAAEKTWSSHLAGQFARFAFTAAALAFSLTAAACSGYIAGRLSKRTENLRLLLFAVLAAIGAASIRPQEVGEALIYLAASDDEEIAHAADKAIAMAKGDSDKADGEEEDEGGWID